MLITGVMPLPAVISSRRPGGCAGSTKPPSTPPSRTIVPGRARVHRYGETVPDSTSFGVIAMQPSGLWGTEVQRVRAPVAHASHLHAEAQVLAWAVPRPAPSGLDQNRDRFGRLARDPHDAPA